VCSFTEEVTVFAAYYFVQLAVYVRRTPREICMTKLCVTSLFRFQSEKLVLAQIESDLRRAREDARRKKHPVTEADRAVWLALPQDIYSLDRMIAECQVM